MHVLHVVCPTQAAGRGVRWVDELVAWLGTGGVRGTVAVLRAGGTAVVEGLREGSADVPLTAAQACLGLRNDRLARLAAAADVVHIHGSLDFPYCPATAAARYCGKPVICSPHGGLITRFLRQPRSLAETISRRLALRAMRHVSGFHFVSQTEMEVSRPLLPESAPWLVSPLALGPPFYDRLPGLDIAESLAPGIRTDGPWMLTMATAEMTSGAYAVSVGAFECVLSRFPRAQLIFLGKHSLRSARSIQRLTSAAENTGSIHFIGDLAGASLLSLYRRADVLIAIGAAEGIDRVALEVVACETPVVFTPDVAVHLEVTAAGAGLVAEPTAWSIGEAVLRVLADEPERRQMGVFGRDWVLRSLDPGAAVGGLRDFYTRVVDPNAGGGLIK